MDRFAFFWPIWSEDHLELIHTPSETPCDINTSVKEQPPFLPSNKPSKKGLSPTQLLLSDSEVDELDDTQYTYHLWSSISYNRYLKFYTLDSFFEETKEKIPFIELARRFIDQSLRERWTAAKATGLEG